MDIGATGDRETVRTLGTRGDYSLTLSDLTLRNADLRTRCAAAAAAGFTGIGLSIEHYRAALEDQLSPADIAAVIAEHGLEVNEVELAAHWADPAAYSEDELESDRTVVRMAAELGASRIHTTMSQHFPLDTLARGLRALCRRAADARACVALEYMPYAAIDSATCAWKVIEASGADNAGLLIDAWHWERAHTADEPDSALRAIPAERVAAIQLCDTLPEPLSDLRREALHCRWLPGHGAAELIPMLRRLARHGVRAPIAVEVVSDELDAQDPYVTARQAYVSSRSVLRDSGWPLSTPRRSVR
ncbi:sugar phosphate isomerase [Nocardia sp. MDA0666]|uniref:sugar phosphate isomerase/epimerase family protein n=1 Tax=Nocardia sp. MDA0666 TaxID=2135448 RepID=UPI000D124CA2|nr:sugar phosphate isomerase/epimerase [Nocardia sp. MDA0666]PSR66856.1 sugar phosphate isomerase [Nocardia sp. MDA0666]